LDAGLATLGLPKCSLRRFLKVGDGKGTPENASMGVFTQPGPEADNYPVQIARKGNIMKYFVGLGLGTAVGTLLFTGLLSAAHEFD